MAQQTLDTSHYEQLKQLKYGQCVVQETLRRYPSAWIVDRKALTEDQIGEHWIPANGFIAVSIYELHHSPLYWEDPMTFKPERFFQPPPEVYIPFGIGPRMCIGNHFALFEMTEVVRQLAQYFILHTDSPPPQELALITLQPKTLEVRLDNRHD